MNTPLQHAVWAVIARWESPAWKDMPHTGEYIDAMRKALADEQAQTTHITPLMEQQMFDDWCPYKGNPDPRTVWAAAIDAANGLTLGATAYPEQAQAVEPAAWMSTDYIGERTLLFTKPAWEPIPDKIEPLYTRPSPPATGERSELIKELRLLKYHVGGSIGDIVNRAADMLEADAGRITELEALSVTNIMLDVVPGDGSGFEIFAKSTSDVEDLLTKMGEKIEDFESSKWAQQVAVPVPMTDVEIYAVARNHPKIGTLVPHLDVRQFARAIEAHHGIGVKP